MIQHPLSLFFTFLELKNKIFIYKFTRPSCDSFVLKKFDFIAAQLPLVLKSSSRVPTFIKTPLFFHELCTKINEKIKIPISLWNGKPEVSVSIEIPFLNFDTSY